MIQELFKDKHSWYILKVIKIINSVVKKEWLNLILDGENKCDIFITEEN